MRIRTFHAKTMIEAMAQVRNDLGLDAIIIQSEDSKNGVRVVAAIEGDAGAQSKPAPVTAPKPELTPIAVEKEYDTPIRSEYDKADVRAVLNHHSLPFDTAERLSQAALAVDAASLPEAFSSALETMVRFSPLTASHSRPIMLIGPPGAGKTVCTAKLTADALINSHKVHLISTDTVKAAGVHQLDHFAQLMKQNVTTAASPQELASVVATKPDNCDLTLIDTQGTNPFDMAELETLLALIHAVDAEPVLVMPAGLDALDAQEIAGVFNKMGCSRFIATRLDASRRYAGIIMAARPGYLSLAGISRSPYVADGLETASSMTFARLLTALPRTHQSNNPKGDTSHD